MLTGRLFLAVSAAKLVSVVGLMLMPVQVGAMLDGLQLGAAAVGFLATMEFSALGVGILFVALNPLKDTGVRSEDRRPTAGWWGFGPRGAG